MASYDVAIVGAGVIGAAIAYRLACRSALHIVILERGTPGCEASNAAAGVLAVASGQARRGVLLDLRRRSANMFPDLVAALEEESKEELGYRRAGLLSLAFSDSEAAALRDLTAHRATQGMRCEMLERAAVLSLESALNPAVCAGALFPDDCSIDSARLVAALVTGAQRRGVTLRRQATVRELAVEADAILLRLPDGDVHAQTVVVAAGAWSGDLLAANGTKLPLRPARGEMAAVRSTTWRIEHTLSTGDGYLVPRVGGEVLIGSTTAFVGFDKRVTESGVATLLARAAEMVPAVRRASLVRSWAGLRPCPTIRRPIIARLPHCENVIVATGHHRNGILLAPITAQMVTEMVLGRPPSVPLQPFGYRKH